MNCKRCGKCCHRGDFWYLSNDPIIKIYATSLIFGEILSRKETGKCTMLNKENDCLIEKYLGRNAKPEVCKEYDCEEKNEKPNT